MANELPGTKYKAKNRSFFRKSDDPSADPSNVGSTEDQLVGGPNKVGLGVKIKGLFGLHKNRPQPTPSNDPAGRNAHGEQTGSLRRGQQRAGSNLQQQQPVGNIHQQPHGDTQGQTDDPVSAKALPQVPPEVYGVVQWPEFITQSFHSAIAKDPIGTEESVFYGPYTRLLYHLFSFHGPYEIVLQYKIRGSQDGIDVTPTFIIELQKKPVFFIEIEPAASLPVITRRQEVDNQMRELVGDLRANLAIPVLHGVSAFGTRLCFYKYDSRSRELTPQRIPQHPTRVTDIMPAHNWSCDVLNTDGMQRLQKVVEEVKEMCAQSRPAT